MLSPVLSIDKSKETREDNEKYTFQMSLVQKDRQKLCRIFKENTKVYEIKSKVIKFLKIVSL